MAVKDYKVTLYISGDQDARFNYSEDYVMSCEEPSRFFDLESEFRRRVKDAVTDFARQQPEEAKEVVQNFGMMFWHEFEADGRGDVVEYVLENFPMRGIASIPTDILERHGMREGKEADCTITSYDDGCMFEEK